MHPLVDVFVRLAFHRQARNGRAFFHANGDGSDVRGGQRQCARSDAGQQRVERLHAVETKTLRIARWLLPCGRLDGVAPGLIRLAGHAAGIPRKRGRIVLTAARATHSLALAGRLWATPRHEDVCAATHILSNVINRGEREMNGNQVDEDGSAAEGSCCRVAPRWRGRPRLNISATRAWSPPVPIRVHKYLRARPEAGMASIQEGREARLASSGVRDKQATAASLQEAAAAYCRDLVQFGHPSCPASRVHSIGLRGVLCAPTRTTNQALVEDGVR